MLQGHSLMLGRYRARQIHEEHGVFNWISWKIWPPVISPRWDSQGDYCYHGTSIHELSNIIFSGGSMKRDITFFCNEPSFSFGYARARARRSLTHGIVLQFDQTMISDRLKPWHYQPVISHDRGAHSRQIAQFSVARENIPLSAMIYLSKQTVLRWMADQRDANPQDSSWSKLVGLATTYLYS